MARPSAAEESKSEHNPNDFDARHQPNLMAPGMSATSNPVPDTSQKVVQAIAATPDTPNLQPSEGFEVYMTRLNALVVLDSRTMTEPR